MKSIRIFKTLSVSFLIITLISACGGDSLKTDTLSEKKAALVKLQTESKDLLAKIEKLKTEIQKIEPLKVDKTKSVAIAPITLGTFEHFVEASGRLEAENNIFVSPQTGGAITRVFVKIGDFVSKGQKIATIDNTILTNSIQEVQLQLETAKTIFERQKALWDQKIGTEVQYIQAKSSVESLERRITTLKSQISQNVVLAPISGMVDEVRLKEGEIAAPGLGIVRIINMQNLKVVASVPDTYAGTIGKGASINIKIPDLQKEINSKITYVSQTINPVSRTFTVEAKVPFFDKNLKPNLNTLVKINDKVKTGSIIIPQNLVQNTEQGTIVYIAEMKGDKKVAKAKIVTVGQAYNGKIEILSGLKAGENLIVEGYQEVVDEQLIAY
jgi:membrane fusion protein, multidrug efflux system